MSEFFFVPGRPNGSFLLRGRDVILDADLAGFYGVSTEQLHEAVACHKQRFPREFMFQLTPQELEDVLKSRGRFTRVKPSPTPTYAFTEPGALMVSSVLNSRTAAKLLRHIMQGFTGLRTVLWEHAALVEDIEGLEQRTRNGRKQTQPAFRAYRELLRIGSAPKRRKKEAPPSDAKPTTKKPSRPKKTRAR